MLKEFLHLKPQLLDDITNMPVSDKQKVRIKCHCGRICSVSTRNLKRRWSTRAYCCKSCSVKTYATDPDRIKKFKKSFAKTAKTPEYKQQCSELGKLPWRNTAFKDRMRALTKNRNQTDPRLAEGRALATKAFMLKHGKTQLAKIRAMQRNKPSMLESIVASLLSSYGIKFTQQYVLGYYAYDFWLPDISILIEVNGDYWHKNTVAKDSAKITYAGKLGLEVKTIWEHEFAEMHKVESLLKEWAGLSCPTQIPFKFQDIVLSLVGNKDARTFYGKYHYLPSISKSGYHIGAYTSSTLIGCASFSGVTRTEIASRLNVGKVRELSRFCIHSSYHKKNFASWLLSRAVRRYSATHPNINAIVAFADTSIHKGTVYKAAGWKYDGQCAANYVYKSSGNYLMHKKTLWDNARKMGMSETDYANTYNYLKVWSKPKNRYVKYLGAQYDRDKSSFSSNN